MVTISISKLSTHHQTQLREILASVGVALPVRLNESLQLRLVADGGRSRSATPVRIRVGQKKFLPNHDILKEFPLYFNDGRLGEFRHLDKWQFRQMTTGRVSAVLKTLFDDPVVENSDDDQIVEELGIRVWRFFQARLGLRALVEFAVLDFFQTALLLRQHSMEVDIFVRLAQGFFDSTDLQFFQYVRNILGPIQDISLCECEAIVKKIFGAEQAHVGQAVLATLEAEIRNLESFSDGPVRIEPSYLVYIALWVFHHQKGTERGKCMQSTQHGFQIRDSLSTVGGSGENNLIDNYIDSILSLKQLTAQSRQSAQRASTQSSRDMEQLVVRVLGEACKAHCGSADPALLASADKLMQAAMNEDKAAWAAICGKPNAHFVKCLNARDGLMAAVDEGKDALIDDALWQFCLSIASALGTRVVRGQ